MKNDVCSFVDSFNKHQNHLHRKCIMIVCTFGPVRQQVVRLAPVPTSTSNLLDATVSIGPSLCSEWSVSVEGTEWFS